MSVDRVAWLVSDWTRVVEAVEGDPAGWLPGPLSMTGFQEFAGTLRLVGVAVPVQYSVGGPWRNGSDVSRRVRLVTDSWVFVGFDGDLCASPGRVGLTRVRLVGGRLVGKTRLARLAGPVTSALVAARVLAAVTAVLDRRLTLSTLVSMPHARHSQERADG